MAESILKNLTMDQKLKAFEKTRAKFSVPGAKLVLITEEYYDAALKFARENYLPHEPLNKAFGVPWSQEQEKFWLKMLKLNLSLMLINEESGEPMAFRVTRIARYDDKINLELIQTPPFRELIRYCVYGDRQADFFGQNGITEAFHFLGLAVADKFKNRGLATQIFNAAIDMIRNFGIDPVYVKVEGSSNFSKKIFENANFEILYELPFATWEVDGKFPIQNTGIHKSMKIYRKKLTAES
ncbi:uncharacterized protein LOC128549178 [Mercenaria mercenaria]|uniref:uncharacterized protein LOC128549178 n=1 Tax=Mercenaria mercenaria TaxID=6596 RepID=UPI00234F4FAD|nr:uncharacterized protein LOC128549178 [Mercenaria mercenaria]